MRNIIIFITLTLLCISIISCWIFAMDRESYNIKYSEGTAAPTPDSTVEPTPTPVPIPEIRIYDTIPTDYDSGSTYDFGNVTSSKDVTFTIENEGDAQLQLTGTPLVEVTDDASNRYSVLTYPQAAIDPGNTTDFIVRFTSNQTSDDYTAKLIIINNDSDEGTYEINVTGYAECS